MKFIIFLKLAFINFYINKTNMEIVKEINKEYSDIDDFEDNLDFYRNIMNLREFEIIFNHEKLIESELL